MCLFTLRLPLKRRGSLLWLHTYINNSTCSEWSSLPQRCVSACINHSQASAVEQMVTLLKDRNSYICRIWRTGVNVGVFHRRRSTCYPHFDMFSFYEKLLLCFEREKKKHLSWDKTLQRNSSMVQVFKFKVLFILQSCTTCSEMLQSTQHMTALLNWTWL